MTVPNLRAPASALVLAVAALTVGAATAQADLAAYRAAVLADAPVAYWPLDEASGAVAADVGGGSHHETSSGRSSSGAAVPSTRRPTVRRASRRAGP